MYCPCDGAGEEAYVGLVLTCLGPVEESACEVYASDGERWCFFNRNLGSGGVSRPLYAGPLTFLQVTQLRSVVLTNCRICGIQYASLTKVSVVPGPACSTSLCAHFTTNSVKWCLRGSRTGCLVVYLMVLFCNRPPQRTIPSLSRKSFS